MNIAIYFVTTDVLKQAYYPPTLKSRWNLKAVLQSSVEIKDALEFLAIGGL